MKKRLTHLLPFSLFLLVLFLAGSQMRAQSCATFYDGFESGTWSPTWLTGTGTYTRTVTTVSPAVGTYSFEQACATSNSFYEGTYTIFTPSQPSYMSWWMKTNTTSAANGYVIIGNSAIASDNGIIFCYFNATSSLRFFNTSGYNHPITANTWYHVEARNMNWTSRNCDIWVNGALILTGWAFRSGSAMDIDRIHTHSLSPSIATYDEFVIGTPDPSIAIASAMDPSCFGDSTGLVDITVTSGSGSYSYLWSTGDTIQDIDSLSAGTYTVLVTDSLGCTATDTMIISEPPLLTVLDSFTTINCFGDTTGIIDLTVAGGTPGYSFLWGGGQMSEDLSGLGAGTYTVQITDSLGCATDDTVTITGPASGVSWTDSLVMPACNGDSAGEIYLNVSGGTPGYSYIWSSGDSTSSLSGLGAGVYDVTVTDSLGCMSTGTYTVSDPPVLIISGSTVMVDSGWGNGSIDLIVSGGTMPYTYTWSNGDSTASLDSLTAGPYTVTITDSLGCTTTDSFFVDLFVGVNIAGTDAQLQLWPNPFTNEFYMQVQGLSGSLRVSVTDLQGREVWHKELLSQPGEKLTFSPSLSAGMYLVRVSSDDRQVTARLVKND